MKGVKLSTASEQALGLTTSVKALEGSGFVPEPPIALGPGPIWCPREDFHYSGHVESRLPEPAVELVLEANRRRCAETLHVTWLRSNLAWAMDDCQKTEEAAECKLHPHNLTDLGSRYRLPPLASHCLPCGEEVVGHYSTCSTGSTLRCFANGTMVEI